MTDLSELSSILLRQFMTRDQESAREWCDQHEGSIGSRIFRHRLKPERVRGGFSRQGFIAQVFFKDQNPNQIPPDGLVRWWMPPTELAGLELHAQLPVEVPSEDELEADQAIAAYQAAVSDDH